MKVPFQMMVIKINDEIAQVIAIVPLADYLIPFLN
jgi:hypothetical protein